MYQRTVKVTRTHTTSPSFGTWQFYFHRRTVVYCTTPQPPTSPGLSNDVRDRLTNHRSSIDWILYSCGRYERLHRGGRRTSSSHAPGKFHTATDRGGKKKLKKCWKKKHIGGRRREVEVRQSNIARHFCMAIYLYYCWIFKQPNCSMFFPVLCSFFLDFLKMNFLKLHHSIQ